MSAISGRLFILGAGGHGKVVADAASLTECWSEILFLDDRFPSLKACESWPVVGAFDAVSAKTRPGDQAIVGLGSSVARETLAEELKTLCIPLATVVHPQASFSAGSTVGAGTVVLAGSTVAISARIGEGCIINARASVDHDGVVGDFSHICPGAHVGATAVVGTHCWIGIGALVENNITLGNKIIVGAGAAVVQDVATDTTMTGAPHLRTP